MPSLAGGAPAVAGRAGAPSTDGTSGARGGDSVGGAAPVSDGGRGDVGDSGAPTMEMAGETGIGAQGGSADYPAGGGGMPTAGTTGAGTSGLAGTGGSGSISVKRVFVTSKTFDGNLKAHGGTTDDNGLKGADAVCNEAAASAGLGGTWTAWLSVTGGDAINRVPDVAPWYLVDQVTKAFDTHAQLAASADVPVNMTENGDTVSGPAWTGTTLLGTAHAARCGEWKTNGTSLGAWGDVANAFDWSYKDTQYCSKAARLYCFEQ